MLNWLKWKLAGAELARLEQWERAWREHDRWLALASSEAELILRNLKAQVDGKALDVCWPPSEKGPWSHAQLREVLNKRHVAAREFTNELGNRIRITIEGPTSTSENVLTPMEANELKQALGAHGVRVDAPAELSEEELTLLDRILEGFADCGETDESHEVLLEFARRGYLECERYAPTNKAHQALEAWRSAGVALGEGGKQK